MQRRILTTDREQILLAKLRPLRYFEQNNSSRKVAAGLLCLAGRQDGGRGRPLEVLHVFQLDAPLVQKGTVRCLIHTDLALPQLCKVSAQTMSQLNAYKNLRIVLPWLAGVCQED